MRISRELVTIAAAIELVLNAVISFGVVELTVEQLAAVNGAVIAVLAVLVRRKVTPTKDPHISEEALRKLNASMR